MSDAVYGYTIAVMAVIMLLCLGVTWHAATRADRAEQRARGLARSLAVVRRERVESGQRRTIGLKDPWRRPPAERFDEHANRALRINDPDATQLNFRDMT